MAYHGPSFHVSRILQTDMKYSHLNIIHLYNVGKVACTADIKQIHFIYESHPDVEHLNTFVRK
jgi:hypothetical protein